MNFTKLKIPEVILFEPKVFGDERGFFFESFNNKEFQNSTGLSESFVQDNHSKSTQGILRGLHYQLPPMTQGKLVRVVSGKVFDVAVDVRKDSPTFGKWVGEVLSEENKKQLWIPPGFAHGFITLSENSEFLYKTTNYYSPEYESCIMWNDPDLNIDWHYDGTITISEKDKQGQLFKDLR
jgi:dTDP-4-dehydrorhamnose 3,5-epimerase